MVKKLAAWVALVDELLKYPEKGLNVPNDLRKCSPFVLVAFLPLQVFVENRQLGLVQQVIISFVNLNLKALSALLPYRLVLLRLVIRLVLLSLMIGGICVVYPFQRNEHTLQVLFDVFVVFVCVLLQAGLPRLPHLQGLF